MTMLLLASIVFVVIHLLPSTPLRGAVINGAGEKVWSVGFSIASIAGIVWMVKAWGAADSGALYYGVGAGLRHGAVLLVFLALALAILGLSTPGDPSLIGPTRGKTGERAVRGALAQDRRHRITYGESYGRYLEQTSFVPFAAIAAGRNHLSFAEIGVWRIVLCVAVFAGLSMGHAYLFGVSPLG